MLLFISRCISSQKPLQVVSRVLNKYEKITHFKPTRAYRGISHGQPPPLNTVGVMFHVFLMGTFLYCVIDFKKLFGLNDEEKEIEELLNYQIPDLIVTYTEMPPNNEQAKKL